MKHRYKNPLQNISKTNLTMFEEIYAPQPSRFIPDMKDLFKI